MECGVLIDLIVVRDLAAPLRRQVLDAETQTRRGAGGAARRRLEHDLFGFDEQSTSKPPLHRHHVLRSAHSTITPGLPCRPNFYPLTQPIPIPMEFPVGIPIPAADLSIAVHQLTACGRSA